MRSKTVYSVSYKITDTETGEEIDRVYQKEGYTIYINMYESHITERRMYDVISKKKHKMSRKAFEGLIKMLEDKIEISD
jgi:hypothetical protein